MMPGELFHHSIFGKRGGSCTPLDTGCVNNEHPDSSFLNLAPHPFANITPSLKYNQVFIITVYKQ